MSPCTVVKAPLAQRLTDPAALSEAKTVTQLPHGVWGLLTSPEARQSTRQPSSSRAKHRARGDGVAPNANRRFVPLLRLPH